MFFNHTLSDPRGSGLPDFSEEMSYPDDRVNTGADKDLRESVDIRKMGLAGKAEIYLAAGCFWGVEAYYKRVAGITGTEVGYANGKTEDTDYGRVAATDHAETVRITYDPNKIHLAEILERFFRIIDPFSVNRQGNDRGRQYRTGIYYTDPASAKLAAYALQVLEERTKRKPAVECAALKNFVRAEDYHQDYLVKNPGGYCHVDLSLAERVLFPGSALPSDGELRTLLSDEAYHVTRERGTEAPWTSPLDAETGEGIYVDVATGQPLFSSADKFDGGCGWPSFTMPLTTDAMVYHMDHRLMRARVEVTASSSNHLGHVFEDGPLEKGALRYCINGAALRFIPLASMDAMGYTALKPFVL